jgi:N utilization substance protein B
MPARHRSRQHALQILYQWDLRRISIDEAIAAFYDTLHSEDENAARPPHDGFMEQLVRGAVSRLDDLDQRIAAKSAHWRIDRMPAVDRNVLRLAVFEMITMATPAAVVIDEALELVRQFSGDESVKFVNGVLDAIRKDEAASA